MLLLLFKVGNDTYAVEATVVVEVLPIVEIKEVRHAPKGVVGTLNYRGALIAVVDLNHLMRDQATQRRLSTRIILAQYSMSGETGLLGLIAANATETIRCNSADFVAPGVVAEAAPYLGPILINGRDKETVQLIEILPLARTVMPNSILKQSA